MRKTSSSTFFSDGEYHFDVKNVSDIMSLKQKWLKMVHIATKYFDKKYFFGYVYCMITML